MFSELLVYLGEAFARSRPLASVAVTLVVALGVLRLKRNLLLTLEARGHLRPAMAGRLHLLLRWLVLLVVLLLVLQQLGLFEHAWAVASAALAAVAVGVVALWSILSNALAAVLILVYRPFRVGDEVELIDVGDETGLRGRVVDMNLMFTVLQQRTAGQPSHVARLHIPNNLFFQKLTRLHYEGERGARASFFGDGPAPS